MCHNIKKMLSHMKVIKSDQKYLMDLLRLFDGQSLLDGGMVSIYTCDMYPLHVSWLIQNCWGDVSMSIITDSC